MSSCVMLGSKIQTSSLRCVSRLSLACKALLACMYCSLDIGAHWMNYLKMTDK